MESKITIIRDNNGKVLGTKRQNPTTKPVIKQPLTVDGKQVFNISELMLKRQSGKTLTVKEEQVLNDYLMHENCKKLTEKSKPLPTLAEVKAKMARGENLTSAETQVLVYDIKKTEAEYAALRKQKNNMIAPMKDFISEKPKFAQPKPFSEPPKTSVTALSAHSSAKTEFPPKPYPTESDRYLQQQEKIRQLEDSAMTRSTGYKPLDNKVKGGFERAIDKMHQLAERSAKMAEKFAKLLEFCKKYGKSFKA